MLFFLKLNEKEQMGLKFIYHKCANKGSATALAFHIKINSLE